MPRLAASCQAGWSSTQPTSTPGRRRSFKPGGPMVEIRVGVADAGGVHGLLRRLAGVFDRSPASYDGARQEVHVRSEWESRGVVQVIGAVEAWLVQDGVDRAVRSNGGRSHLPVG